MNNKQWSIGAASLLLWLTSCAIEAEAACTDRKRVLRIGVNSIALEQKDSRCVLAPDNSQSGTFDIEVKPEPGYMVSLDTIAVDAKDRNGPLTFEVIDVLENDQILVVEVTWGTGAPPETEQGYTIHVPELGVLDPTVQIIRASLRMAYTTALQQLAEEYLDAAAYDFIVRELLPLEKDAAGE